jgi:mono/diheme cytochrome c family protein
MRRGRAAITGMVISGLALVGMAVLNSCGSSSLREGEGATPRVTGQSKEAIGRYIVLMGGCNDCHTPGAMEGHLPPESQWLTGSPLGFNGPWGTTYAPNLRLKVAPYNEKSFVKTMKARNSKPPMSWESLHAMTDEDLGAVFVYIRSLGASGQPMPEATPPEVKPIGPYIVMAPPTIGREGASAPAGQPGAP